MCLMEYLSQWCLKVWTSWCLVVGGVCWGERGREREREGVFHYQYFRKYVVLCCSGMAMMCACVSKGTAKESVLLSVFWEKTTVSTHLMERGGCRGRGDHQN